MFHVSPFQLNKYISFNRFNDILGALIYTNEEVQYIDTFFGNETDGIIVEQEYGGRIQPWMDQCSGLKYYGMV